MPWEIWRYNLTDHVYPNGFTVITVLPRAADTAWLHAGMIVDRVVIIAYHAVKNEYVTAHVTQQTYAANEWHTGHYTYTYPDAMRAAAQRV